MSVSTPFRTNRVLMLADGVIRGGHLMQAQKTAELLRLERLDVVVADGPMDDLSGYDIVHAFGSPPNIRQTLREARRQGARVVISPIFWEYRRPGPWQSAGRSARLAASSVRRGVDKTAAGVRRSTEEAALLLELADLLLPNSQSEADRIRSTLGVTTPIRVVHNGFDDRIFSPPDGAVERRGVACVARLEPHKNQLELIRALRRIAAPLTLVGDDHPHHSSYAARCRAAAGPDVIFRSGLTQEELAELFRTVAVHVLPSWFETTGLVSLEAAACGSAVVTTFRGDTREYFGDLAFYCDPARKGSITTAVEKALELGAAPELASHVRDRFTWKQAAQATYEAYVSVLR
jgi:glycosyltransferase involved in cell wall biosynthesis